MHVRRLKDQRGFTTVTLMGVLLVGGLLVAAGFTAVNPDIGFTRDDQDTKLAYNAAESGVQWYVNQLARDNTYYLKCDGPPNPNSTEVAPVNAPVRNNSTGNYTYPSGFKWRNLPGEASRYGIDLIPASGYTQCSTTDQYSMVDPEGNIVLRVTGRSRDETRTILASLRRLNFLDYIYFTQFETLDPAAYSDPNWAQTNCAKYRSQRSSSCTEIQFAANDDVLGPFHTNDNIRVCGSTQFGENSRDRIEINGSPAWTNGSCSANPDIRGTLINPADELGMPPSNQELANIAASAYRFTGKTKINLTGTTMQVTTYNSSGTPSTTTTNLPSNGVIYVNSSATCGGYQRDATYTEAVGCGNVYVHGSYGKNLTIGAANDIIVDGNLTRASDDLLMGLVANNFVRVYHPCSSGNGTGSISNLTIQAAILALSHSFIVDNWDCGTSLGTLNVDGAIAQYFRGPVGTTANTGYVKNYTYNRRLKYREPPFFLDPSQAKWRIVRETEQTPPCTASNTTCPVP